MSSEKVNLSSPTEFELRNQVILKVYPASLETFATLGPKLKEMEKAKSNKVTADIEKQVDLFTDIIFELVKDDNSVDKKTLRKSLTLEACIRIMQKALGAFGMANLSTVQPK